MLNDPQSAPKNEKNEMGRQTITDLSVVLVHTTSLSPQNTVDGHALTGISKIRIIFDKLEHRND